MDRFLITFFSVTQAERASRLLAKRGISAVLRPAPAAAAFRGCAYALEGDGLSRAVSALRLGGAAYGRAYSISETGGLREVSP